ncbi:P-loop NTPase family protein [Xinfangfangia pollutisoli]|uniref:DnaA ATPase domain-containing protein n=1 Tax=Xinfangfangia pollutisoli TaxID=2865960 RepID=UPI001CD460A6|nr:DnaA/Hda family protein [Xinfangfangia pollutisoli]
MSRQLAFDLPAQENLSRADFVVSPANALALAAIGAWRDWPLGKMLIVGPAGAGKTHLAAIWAAETGAPRLAAADLDGLDLAAFDGAPALVVEDAEAVAGKPALEEALFHLHNLILRSGPLLLTAKTPPRDWGLRLPDLYSRMQAAALTRIEAPDDALLSAVLVKLFADRQLAVAPQLIAYLLPRMDRTIGAARALVAALDALALETGRAITPRLAAEILDREILDSGAAEC